MGAQPCPVKLSSGVPLSPFPTNATQSKPPVFTNLERSDSNGNYQPSNLEKTKNITSNLPKNILFRFSTVLREREPEQTAQEK